MAVTRLDKIAGIHLESVKHTANLLNGNVVQLGNLVAGETELYEVKVPSTNAEVTDGVYLLHATPELDADPRKKGLKHFVVEAGTAGRAYHVEVGDVVTITSDLIEGTPVVGNYVVPQLSSVQLEASTDGTTIDSAGTGVIAPRLQFRVERETTLGYDNSQAWVLRVVKA